MPPRAKPRGDAEDRVDELALGAFPRPGRQPPLPRPSSAHVTEAREPAPAALVSAFSIRAVPFCPET
jgi:hypothetical protein